MAERHDVFSDPFTATLIRIKAAQLCRRTDFSWSDRDDLTQQMLVYLLEKAHLYDPARGNVEAFVTNAIDSWVAMELRFRGRHKRRGDYKAISLEGTLVECDGDSVPLRSVLGQADQQRRNQAAPACQFDAAETAEAVAAVMGVVATEGASPMAFVLATQPIKADELGRCVLTGVTPARVFVNNELDTTCDLAPDETVLTSTPMGGVPILWKEEGLGEKWAVIEMGRPSSGRVTAILGAAQPIPSEHNRWRYPWQEARLDGDPGSETYLRYVAVPDGLSSQLPSGGEDPTLLAINRFEAHYMNTGEPGSGFEGLLGLGPVCDLPGVLPKCPPARSLRPKLVPIPEGVCVQLTCERNSKGRPVWVFEAMTLMELADPADGDRKFNLFVEGAG